MNIEDLTDKETSWGNHAIERDFRAKIKYHSLLLKILKAGEVLFVSIFVCTLLSAALFFYIGDFEQDVFDNGVGGTCVLKGNGELVNAR